MAPQRGLSLGSGPSREPACERVCAKKSLKSSRAMRLSSDSHSSLLVSGLALDPLCTSPKPEHTQIYSISIIWQPSLGLLQTCKQGCSNELRTSQHPEMLCNVR